MTRGPPQSAGISVAVGEIVGVGVSVLVGDEVREAVSVAVEGSSGLNVPQPRSSMRRTQQNNRLISLNVYEDLRFIGNIRYIRRIKQEKSQAPSSYTMKLSFRLFPLRLITILIPTNAGMRGIA